MRRMGNPPPKEDSPNPIDIIGMGMGPGDLTAAHLCLIEEAALLIGGRRHLAFFKNQAADTLEITSDLKGLAEEIRRQQRLKRVVVLASGDPLYYGIGAYLVKVLGRQNVRIHPNINAVAAACARMGEPWQDVSVVSLHGRQREERLRQAIHSENRIAVFTDPTRTPQWLGHYLCLCGAHDFRIGVFECMGSDQERISWHTPEAIADMTFRTPNLVFLKRDNPTPRGRGDLHFGMAESAFDHERGVITKAEVRAVSLARLCLKPHQVLWDLGAGSGAVAIEASLLVPGGRIWAVEKNTARLEHIRANRDRFYITNLEVVEACLPNGLDQLPDPDRVFIGGGGQALGEIVVIASRRLPPDGILVVNTVLLDSLNETVKCLEDVGLETDVVQIQVSRSRPLAASRRFEAMNPVWIIRGQRTGAAI